MINNDDVSTAKDVDEKQGKQALPSSILFVCGKNSIRSPIAELLTRRMLSKSAYIASAGVKKGERDPFVDAVLAEIDISPDNRQPRELDELEDGYFDLIVTLTPLAHHTVLEKMRGFSVEVEYWPTPDPTLLTGSREQILVAYRDVRDRLQKKIEQRFM
ncbi:low molecular weight phosphatase family protein [Brucellaceae bacterium C25G]